MTHDTLNRSVTAVSSQAPPPADSCRGIALKIATFLSITGIVIGLAGVAFVYIGFLLGGLSPGWLPLVCVFCIAVSTYAYDYSRDRPYRMAFLFIALPPLILFGLLLWKQNWPALVWAVSLVLLGLTYATVFKPLSTRVAGFKDLYVGLIWMLLLPFSMACQGEPWTGSLSLAAAFLFLSILINISACDVKDMDEDSRRRLRTFVVVLGRRRFFRFMHLLNLLSGLLLVFGVWAALFPVPVLVLLISPAYTSLYLRGIARHGGGRLYATYVIDAHYCWLALLLYATLWLYR